MYMSYKHKIYKTLFPDLMSYVMTRCSVVIMHVLTMHTFKKNNSEKRNIFLKRITGKSIVLLYSAIVCVRVYTNVYSV